MRRPTRRRTATKPMTLWDRVVFGAISGVLDVQDDFLVPREHGHWNPTVLLVIWPAIVALIVWRA